MDDVDEEYDEDEDDEGEEEEVEDEEEEAEEKEGVLVGGSVVCFASWPSKRGTRRPHG